MKTHNFMAVMVAVIAMSSVRPSPVLAHGTGGALRPASEAEGSAVHLTHQVIGEVLLQDHAWRRIQRQTIWRLLLRLQAQDAEVYDSAQSWTGRNCVTPVRDQDETSMCWNFSATAALEASYCTNLGETIDAAEQTVLECFDGRISRFGRQNTVGNETRAYDVMRGVGVEQEVLNRFDPDRIKACRKSSFGQTYYGVEGVTILPDQVVARLPTVNDIKRGVVDNGAVTVLSFNTTRFENYVAGGQPIANTTVEVKIATDNNSLHEVVIVGWDDTLGAWHVKNSWGVGWGDAGFAWVVYNDLAMVPGFFTHVTPATKRGAVDTSRLVLMTYERLIRIPSIWKANPTLQFPASLGFPSHKTTLIDATKFMISRSILGPAVIKAWPVNVREILL